MDRLQPKISVIMPVYNMEPYLAKSLNSVFNQFFIDYELIVVDDGSTDNSSIILHDYYERYFDKMTILKQENQGQGNARNRALEIVNGKYVVFIDGDDIVESDYLQVLYGEAEKNQYDVVLCGFQKVDGKGNLIEKVCPRKTGDKGFLIQSLGCCSKMIRMDFLRKHLITFASNKYYEDVPFSFLVSYLSEKRSIIEYSGYLYLQREGSTMSKKIEQSKIPFIEIMEAIVYIRERSEQKNLLWLEYGLLYFFTAFLFRTGRRSSVRVIGHICDYVDKILQQYFPKYYKNPYLHLWNRSITVPKVHRVGVFVFAGLCRFRLLKPFAMIVTRI